MRKLLLRSALSSIGACAILLFFAQYVHDVPVVPGHVSKEKEGVTLSEEDFVSLAKNVYFEARGEDEEGQKFVAKVTLRRWLSGWPEFGGPTIRDVVYHKTTKNVKGRKITMAQFSWSPKDPVPQDMVAWDTAQRIAREVWDEMRTFGDPSPEVMWYMNPETSDPRGRRWFERTLVPVAKVGKHVAFRKPKTIAEEAQQAVAWLIGQLSPVQASEKKAPQKKQGKKKK